MTIAIELPPLLPVPPRNTLPMNPGDMVRAVVPIVVPGWSQPATPGYLFTLNEIINGKAIIYREKTVAEVSMDSIEQAYHQFGGAFYSTRAHPGAIRALHDARVNGWHVRVHRGYTEFDKALDKPTAKEIGQDWLEENDCQGRLALTSGRIKLPLLLANSRSTYGNAEDGGSVVRVKSVGKGGRVLWQHSHYRCPVLAVRAIPDEERTRLKLGDLRFEVTEDGSGNARFRTETAAHRYVNLFR